VELLINMPGVIEATLVHDELADNNAVAYLKVDDKTVNLQAVKAMLQG